VEARDAIKPKIAAHGRRVTGSKKLGSVTRRPVSFHLKTSYALACGDNDARLQRKGRRRAWTLPA
jgi:hypothetical protein